MCVVCRKQHWCCKCKWLQGSVQLSLNWWCLFFSMAHRISDQFSTIYWLQSSDQDRYQHPFVITSFRLVKLTYMWCCNNTEELETFFACTKFRLKTKDENSTLVIPWELLKLNFLRLVSYTRCNQNYGFRQAVGLRLFFKRLIWLHKFPSTVGFRSS